MCLLVHLTSPSCRHHWLSVAHPYGIDKGFNSCFRLKKRLPRQKRLCHLIAPRDSCPKCNWGSNYDRNSIKMLRDESLVFSLQSRPLRRDLGPGYLCAGMWGLLSSSTNVMTEWPKAIHIPASCFNQLVTCGCLSLGDLLKPIVVFVSHLRCPSAYTRNFATCQERVLRSCQRICDAFRVLFLLYLEILESNVLQAWRIGGAGGQVVEIKSSLPTGF